MQRFRKFLHKQVFEGSSSHTSSSSVSGTGKDSLRLIPLGGIGNVTKNMYVYEYRYDGKIRDILLVDCGIGFPDPEMYGVDLVIPDVRYLENKKHLIRGLVFTHGHDDHIGGIPFLYPKIGPIPMYGTTLTAAFANIKLREIRIKEKVQPLTFDQTISIGPFRISFARVTHSVPDAANLIIQTPVGVIYHGSDFKFDFQPLDDKLSDLDKITDAGRKGVVCLLTDCLGSERRGFTASEQIVGETIEKELSFCTGRFIFTTQSSNISRVQKAIEVALAHGRQIAFLGRSIDQNVEESVKLGYMKFPRESVIRDRDLRRLSPNKQFLLVAGSQGQPDSALSKIANDAHAFARLDEGDTVMISADPIPGNEYNVNALIDQLYRKGARVSYSGIMEDLHVSGHGSQGDLMLMLTAVRPQYILPIGGTYRHMVQYRRLAQDIGYKHDDVIIPSEGEVLEFVPGKKPRVVETIELENIMVDGLGVGDVRDIVLRDRQTIATDGIVVIVVPIEESTGRVVGSPDIISRGFTYMKDSGNLVDTAKGLVMKSLRLKKGRMTDWQFVRKQIEMSVATFLRHETGRNPLIVPVVVEV